jgi:hypothetical protein
MLKNLRWWYHREKEAIRSTKIVWSKQLLLGGRRVLGDGLGAFWDSVLGKLTGEDKTDAGDGSQRMKVEDEVRITYEVWISREEMVDFLL